MGGTCTRIRYCDDANVQRCAQNATCNLDSSGSPSCTCNSGFTGDAQKRTSSKGCADQDGCALEPCFKLGATVLLLMWGSLGGKYSTPPPVVPERRQLSVRAWSRHAQAN